MFEESCDIILVDAQPLGPMAPILGRGGQKITPRQTAHPPAARMMPNQTAHSGQFLRSAPINSPTQTEISATSCHDTDDVAAFSRPFPSARPTRAPIPNPSFLHASIQIPAMNGEVPKARPRRSRAKQSKAQVKSLHAGKSPVNEDLAQDVATPVQTAKRPLDTTSEGGQPTKRVRLTQTDSQPPRVGEIAEQAVEVWDTLKIVKTTL